MTPDVRRRSILAGGLGAVACGAITSSPAAASPGRPPGGAPGPGVTTPDLLVEQRADPFITRPVAGTYYFTGSVPEYDRLVVRGAPTIAGLRTAPETVVWRRPASGRTGGHVWAPELHRIDGRWYLYFAAGDSGDVFNIRMYVLESSRADPRDPAGWGTPREVTTAWGSFKLDATTFAHRGRRYYVWAQAEPELAVNTSLYIAEMASPFALKGEPARISTPTLPWEVRGFKVNEGPAVLARNGRVFMTFSASATDDRYCMGLLTADEDADLLDMASWTKSPQPVFETNVATHRYGPGHNSFTVAEDGVTDVLVYHARDYAGYRGTDPLYDPNRHARVQKLYWNADGTPAFGVPVGDGGPVVRLSPGDARTSFVHHDGAAVRVGRDVPRVADSWFRFVPGPAGEGTESLQSVNAPDRHLVVAGTEARLEPAPAVAASFRRRPDGAAVALELAGSPGTYLRHEGGRLTVGRGQATRATFRLS